MQHTRFVQHIINSEKILGNPNYFTIQKVITACEENELIRKTLESDPKSIELPGTMTFAEAFKRLEIYSGLLEELLEIKYRDQLPKPGYKS